MRVSTAPAFFTTPPRVTPLQLLHLEDNPADHQLVRHALRRHEVAADWRLVDTLQAFEQALEDGPVDAVLADYHLAGFTGLEAWRSVQARRPDLPFVLVSGAIGEGTVAEAMVLGVSDYVDKHQLARLPQVLQRALALAQARREQAQAARALAESRQRLAELAEHLQASIDQERAHIAREIHDDIGGSLAAVKLDLTWLARRSPDDDSRRHVASALAMAEHALGASQRIMRNLRPAVLDQGLWPALQWLAQSWSERVGVAAHCAGGLRQPLPPAVEMVAYRTAQEALTNVHKHAQARSVRIELSDLEDHLTLEISDDGCGADLASLDKPRAFGLLGLRERARTVGGWLDTVSAPGAGTSVILSVPLAGATTPLEAGDD